MLQSAAAYFGLVFGAGVILGTFRTLWLVPRVGVRVAELSEIPVMLVAVAMAARWVVRHYDGRDQRWWLAAGSLALVFLLTAEALLGSVARQIPPWQALLDKDPVSGTAYYLALIVFAILPSRLAPRAKR